MNLAEFTRFASVGLAQNLLNVGLFAGLVALGVDYRLAAVLSGAGALLASYALNRRWTFVGHGAPIPAQLMRYTAVFALASAVGVAILSILVGAGWGKVPAQVAAITIVAPLSYVAQRMYTFRHPPRVPDADRPAQN